MNYLNVEKSKKKLGSTRWTITIENTKLKKKEKLNSNNL